MTSFPAQRIVSLSFLILIWCLGSGFTTAVTTGTEISLDAGVSVFPQSRNIRVNPDCNLDSFDGFFVYLISFGLLCTNPPSNEFVRETVDYFERSASVGLRQQIGHSFGVVVNAGVAKLEVLDVRYDEPRDSPDFPYGETEQMPKWEWVGGGVARGIHVADWGAVELGTNIQRYSDGWSVLPSARLSVWPVRSFEVHASFMEEFSVAEAGLVAAGVCWKSEKFRFGLSELVITHPRMDGSFAWAERFEVGTTINNMGIDLAGILGGEVFGGQVRFGLYLD